MGLPKLAPGFQPPISPVELMLRLSPEPLRPLTEIEQMRWLRSFMLPPEFTPGSAEHQQRTFRQAGKLAVSIGAGHGPRRPS